MAISKKGLRKIEVDGEEFYWKVRKKISHNEAHDEELGIPIQHKSDGQLLIACIGFCRSDYPWTEHLTSIKPSLIRTCILKAIELGWKYDQKGKPIKLILEEFTNDKSTSNTRWRLNKK